MRKDFFEKIFYVVSISGAMITVLFFIFGTSFQTQANADDIREIKQEFKEIRTRLQHIEDAVHVNRDVKKGDGQ